MVPTEPTKAVVESIRALAPAQAAAPARAAEVQALGIDAQPARPLPPETRRVLLHPSEMFEDGAARSVAALRGRFAQLGGYGVTLCYHR